MGKTILELFQKEKLENLNTVPGVPVSTNGSTAAEKYDIRNTNNIVVSTSSPTLKPAFWALNGVRKIKERKSESFLEEELSGARVLRTLSLPIIYGTDIIRLTTESTSVVEKMKNSANGGEGSGFTNFGQKIQATRDKIANSKFLGLPKPLNPTEYYTEFEKPLNPVYDRMIKINEIKENAAGTQFGKILKNSAGNPSGFGKQVLGNSIAVAKKQLKKKILGVKGQSKNGNNDFSNLNDQDEPYILYSQYTDERYSTGKASKLSDDSDLKYNIRDIWERKIASNDTYPNITLEGRDAGSKTYYTRKYENFDLGNNGGPRNYNVNNKFTIKYGYTNYGGNSSFRNNTATQNADYDRQELGKEGIDWRRGFPQTIRSIYDSGSEVAHTYKPENKPSGYYSNSGGKGSFFSTSTKQPYTENVNGGGTQINTATKLLEDQFPASEFDTRFKLQHDEFPRIPDENGQPGFFIDVNNLRPSYLKNKKKGDNTGYSKAFDSQNKLFKELSEENETYTNPPPYDQSLSGKKGLDSNFDIINQTGVLNSDQLENLDYNGNFLQEVDLIPLRFQKVNDYSSVYVRAVISNYQESFKPNWEASQFLGDPFKVYSYTAIDRTLSFDVQFYAMSHLELVNMWKKIDWIAHLAYPHSFTTVGVTPSLFYFTLGNLFIDKPAILTSLNFSLDEKSLWEIGGVGGRVKNGNAYLPFDQQFDIDGKLLSVKGTPVKYKRNIVKDDIENTDYGYIIKENAISEAEANDESNKVVFLNYGGKESDSLSMSKFKLPQSIKASFELTLLESEKNTKKLYNYGETITNGAPQPPTPPIVTAPQEKATKTEDAKKQEEKAEPKPGDQYKDIIQKQQLAKQDTTLDRGKSEREKVNELKFNKAMAKPENQQKLKDIESLLKNKTVKK